MPLLCSDSLKSATSLRNVHVWVASEISLTGKIFSKKFFSLKAEHFHNLSFVHKINIRQPHANVVEGSLYQIHGKTADVSFNARVVVKFDLRLFTTLLTKNYLLVPTLS